MQLSAISLALTRVFGGGVAAFDPLSLFSSGEQGVFFDPSDLTTMFQDSTGITPVTADGQPVGLILDKSKGLVLGPELVTNGDASEGSTGWSVESATLDTSGGAFAVTATAGFGFIQQNISKLGVKSWEIRFDVTAQTSANQGVVNIYSTALVLDAASSVLRFNIGSHRLIYSGDGLNFIQFRVEHSGQTLTFDNISIKELPGNHASQATAASRPLLAATGLSDWTNYDAVDDVLNTTFPSSLGTDCTVARANVGGAPTILTGQTIGTSYAESTDNAGLIIIDRALTTQETTDLTAWLTAKGATA